MFIFIIFITTGIFYLIFQIKKRRQRMSLLLFLGVFIFTAFFIDHFYFRYMSQTMQLMKKFIEQPQEQFNFFVGEDDVSIIKIKNNVLIDAPVINQFPELPRGCEVTALAMLLQYNGMDVDKMTLAEQVIKDPTPYQLQNGKIHFGHPNVGFVGNMYTYDKPGLGVYHQPIRELAEQYMPGKIIDLTGSEFDDLKVHLSDGRPVWVIINTAYRKLPDSYFQTWQTAQGEIEITYKEHSVLITGYDNEYIYFNDPLIGKKNRKESIEGFIDAWIQMGRQAITYLP